MKSCKLYALTPQQAHMLQHALEAIETEADFVRGGKRRALLDAWQSLSRPIQASFVQRKTRIITRRPRRK